MIAKELRNKILNMHIKKEDKLFAGHIIDLVNKFENSNYVVHTNFLSIAESEIAIRILNKLKINYDIFKIIEDIERTVIFLIPEYIEKETIYYDYISCIKLIPSVKNKLSHREYMGAIYSLGIDRGYIGDIFVVDDTGYVFTLKSMLEYFKNNLLKVGKVEVKPIVLDLASEEINNIGLEYKKSEIMVHSLRLDAIIAEVYNVSRNEIQNKIKQGDILVNSKEMFFVANILKEKDIISVKKYGKFKVGKELRRSKSGKIVLEIFKYI